MLVRGVAADQPDLTMRQLAVLLTVYITAPPHTVRGLAANLNISKPAVTRALDRLSDLGLARTVRGSVYLSELAQLIGEASISALAEASG